MYWNLVIGAAISIVSSAIGALLTHLFHIMNLNNKRKWEIEDEYKSIKKVILLERLEQFEKLVIDYGRRLSIYESLINPITTYDEIKEEQEKDRFPDWNENMYLLSYLRYFDDEKLVDCFFKFGMAYKDLRSQYFEFVENLKKGKEINFDEFNERSPGSEFALLFANVIKRIDFLKEQYLK